jgi:flagellar FliJ protein
MKQFVFTLQTVLDIAFSTEKQQKIEMKKIEARLSSLFLELEEMRRSFAGAKANHAKEIVNGIQAERLKDYSQYFESINAAMIIEKEKIRAVEAEKEKLIEEQIQTKKEIKTLEKLKDSQYEAYLQELKKEEEKAIGDLVSYKASST